MSSITPSEPLEQAPAGRLQQSLLAGALCLPGALLIVVTAVMLGLLPFGIDPLWEAEPLTLPEAAALRDNGEAVRLIWSGADPDAPGEVRAGIVHSNAQVLTPLEAATASRRADMMELLVEQGASIDAATWTRLFCIATDVDSDDAREFLEPRRPPDASGSCEGVQTPWSDTEP